MREQDDMIPELVDEDPAVANDDGLEDGLEDDEMDEENDDEENEDSQAI